MNNNNRNTFINLFTPLFSSFSFFRFFSSLPFRPSSDLRNSQPPIYQVERFLWIGMDPNIISWFFVWFLGRSRSSLLYYCLRCSMMMSCTRIHSHCTRYFVWFEQRTKSIYLNSIIVNGKCIIMSKFMRLHYDDFMSIAYWFDGYHLCLGERVCVCHSFRWECSAITPNPWCGYFGYPRAM